MKMVICFDTEDPKGMENTIKMVDHLAKEYANRRIAGYSEASFGKIEFIKVVRAFASRIAEAQGLTAGLLEEGQRGYREKEDWEGLRFAKQFADRVFEAKNSGRRITTTSLSR